MAKFLVLAGCVLLTAVAASPSQQPTLQARNWIHHAKEVEAQLKAEKHHNHLKYASLLSTRIRATEGVGATKLLRELGAASDAVQKELKKDNAPVSLQHEEMKLLSEAEDAVHNTAPRARWNARRAAFLQKLKSKELKKAGHKVSMAQELRQSEKQLANYVNGMSKVAHEDRKVLKQTKNVARKAEEALAQVHASKADQEKVFDLLQQAEKFENKEVSLERKEVASGKKELKHFKAYAARVMKSHRK